MSAKPERPVRTLELATEIDASPEAVWKALTDGREVANWFAPEAESHGSGPGSRLTFAWSDEMRWTTSVDVWEEGRRLRWFDSPSMAGEGTAMACEWTLEGRGGRTRLTLVQSAFGGEPEAWEDLFDGMEMGWTYFLYHLRVYLEELAGRERHMIASRFPVRTGREAAWRKLLTPEGGLFAAGRGSAARGDRLQVQLGERTAEASVDLAVPGRILALRLPGEDAILFLEFEGRSEDFHIGAWWSVHDARKAGQIRSEAMRALDRARAAVA